MNKKLSPLGYLLGGGISASGLTLMLDYFATANILEKSVCTHDCYTSHASDLVGQLHSTYLGLGFILFMIGAYVSLFAFVLSQKRDDLAV